MIKFQKLFSKIKLNLLQYEDSEIKLKKINFCLEQELFCIIYLQDLENFINKYPLRTLILKMVKFN